MLLSLFKIIKSTERKWRNDESWNACI